MAGAGSGAVIGGALGWLAGIGMLAIPGVGPFIAAGPIVATLAGIGAGGAIGGTAGALIGLGLPGYQAIRYEGRMRTGGILLSVHTDDHEWATKAKQILAQTGAEDISAIGETKGISPTPTVRPPRSSRSRLQWNPCTTETPTRPSSANVPPGEGADRCLPRQQ